MRLLKPIIKDADQAHGGLSYNATTHTQQLNFLGNCISRCVTVAVDDIAGFEVNAAIDGHWHDFKKRNPARLQSRR